MLHCEGEASLILRNYFVSVCNLFNLTQLRPKAGRSLNKFITFNDKFNLEFCFFLGLEGAYLVRAARDGPSRSQVICARYKPSITS